VKIAIVGGSVAGLSLAWALRRRGLDATVLERSRGLLGHQGAGVMLGASMVKSLELTDTRPVNRCCYLGTNGQVLWEQPVDKHAVSWGDVYGIVRRHTADAVIHEHCLVEGIEVDPPRLRLARGGQDRFDLIVGADGIGSVVRAHVDPGFAPRYLGYIALRGLVPRVELPGSMPAVVDDLFGDAMAKLLMDGEHATLYGLPEEAEPLNWMWYVNFPESAVSRLLTDRNGRRHAWSLPPGALRAEIEKELRELASARLPVWMNSVVAATDTLFLQPIFSGIVKHPVRAGAVLIGDAAHLAVPHIGAGVTLAVEDSFSLAEIITGECDDRAARLDDWAEARRKAAKIRLGLATRLGRSLQTPGKSWLSWSAQDFNDWWERLLAGTPADK